MDIRQLRLISNDIGATTRFYHHVLGLPLLHSNNDSVTFGAGYTQLTFEASPLPRPVYHFAFTIPSAQLQEALQYMQSRTAIFPLPDDALLADFSDWNAKAFYFRDNNGNIAEFIVRYDLESPESRPPFSGKSIMAVSEIGIVTGDVPALADRLCRQYALPVFRKQPPQDHFTALGDDRGLFILVARGRHWYPTDIAAEAFPATIVFRDDTGRQQELGVR